MTNLGNSEKNDKGKNKLTVVEKEILLSPYCAPKK
jgi:hypothetical protein